MIGSLLINFTKNYTTLFTTDQEKKGLFCLALSYALRDVYCYFSFYTLELVERTYGISIKKVDLPKRSRVISRLESYFKTNPIPNNVRFSHIKPAEHLMANIETTEVPEEILSRFQKVFDSLNERKSAVPDKFMAQQFLPRKAKQHFVGWAKKDVNNHLSSHSLTHRLRR